MDKIKDNKQAESKPELYIVLGTVVSFPKNEIRFYQDHQFYAGIPVGVEFTIQEKSNHNYYWLVADGYGNLKKPNCYGSGSICVDENDIKWALSQ